MKNKLCALAIVTAVFTALPVVGLASGPAQNNGFFINGSVGQSSYDDDGFDDNDTMYGGNVGYRWGMFGIEGGYTDLGQFADSAGTTSVEARLEGWNLGVNGHFSINDNWYISARGGAFFWDASVDIWSGDVAVPTHVRAEGDGTGWYGGVGLGFDFNNNFGLGLNYDRYTASEDDYDFDSDVVSLTAEYRF